MGQTSFFLDGFLGTSEVWPWQKDTRIPMGMWEVGGFLALSQLRTSLQEMWQHGKCSEMFTSGNSTQRAS